MKLLRGLLALAYPILVYAGLHWLEPRRVALLLGCTVALRAATQWRRPSGEELRRLLAPALLVAGVVLPTLVLNDARFLLFVPAGVNAALLYAFGRTLVAGPPLVETLARLKEGRLTDAEARYCRSVTVAWCVFFAANASVCLWLALEADLWRWTLYTGCIAYLLMGLLFAAEFVVRSRRFGHYEGTLVEPLFRRLFPQGPTG